MLRRLPRSRWALLAASLSGIALCAGCGSLTTSTTLGPARRLVIALPGAPSALYAPVFEAMSDGDFARGAISLSVSTSGAPLSALESGSAGIAIASEPALLAARDGGARLIAIGALEREPLDAIISLAPRAVTKPSQLIGKSVATTGTPLAAAELSSFLARGNVPVGRVHMITTANLAAALTSHRAIAAVGGLWDYDAVQLRLARHAATALPVDSAGVPSFTQLAIVVRIGEARYAGALLRAFLQSLTRGETAVEANPAAAAVVLSSFNPSLTKRFELAVLTATDPITSPGIAGEPFGYQNPYAWEKFGNWMSSNGLLHHTANAGLAVTNEFLPGQGE
jgi:ABC-type nitrate/sulfonate/bicarbonate transport system substrate-binding protein